MKLVHKISSYCKKNNIFYLNLINTNIVGIPDAIIIKNGKLTWIELKDTGDRLSHAQKYMMKALDDMEQAVYIVTSVKQLEEILNEQQV